MPPEPCIQCTRPGTRFCASCAEYDATNTLIHARWYCDALCQATEKYTHTTACYNSLFNRAKRAGAVVQALFYAFVQNTWAHDMSDIRISRRQNGELAYIEVIAGPGVYSGPGGDSSLVQCAGGWMYKFPDEAFDEEGRDKDVKRAVLADQNSIWAFVVMHSAVRTMFEDLVEDVNEDIKEVVHRLPSNARRLVQHQACFGLALHTRRDNIYSDDDEIGDVKGIYAITLKDGTKIALDLAGAQYNLPHATVLRWPMYLDRWGETIKYRVPFRSHHAKHMKLMSNYHCITHITVVMEQSLYFSTLVLHSREEIGYHLKDMLSMNPEHFNNTLHHLTDQAHRYMRQRPKELDEGTHPNSLVAPFDLRHPKIVAKLPKGGKVAASAFLASPDFRESMPCDLGDIGRFKWYSLRRLIQMPGKQVGYKEKKMAKALLGHRCVYKMPGDWKLVFLQDTLPSVRVPFDCVNENPHWKRS